MIDGIIDKDLNLIKIAIHNGANINDHNYHALYLAGLTENKDIIEFLIKNGHVNKDKLLKMKIKYFNL